LHGAELMGFEGVSLCALAEDGRTYQVARSRGLPSSFEGSVRPATGGMVAEVLYRGETVTVEDYSAVPDAIPLIRDEGFRSTVASPIWIEGWLAAVLIAGRRTPGIVQAREVEAFELL